MISNNSNKPLISVIVLTYNQEHTVSRTIDSILAQKTEFSFEIIIGEDASPADNTRAVCEDYMAKHPDIIRLMPKASNKGLLRNYIDCLHECRGKYVAGCAGDDWWICEEKLQMQVEFLEANSDYGVVHTDYMQFRVNDNKAVPSPVRREIPEGNVYAALFKNNFIAAPTTCFRHELVKYIDFDSWEKHGIKIEDYPMWMEFAHHSKIHYINKSTVMYSVAIGSLSNHINLDEYLCFLEQPRLVQLYFYDKYQPQNITRQAMDGNYYKMLYMASLQFNDVKRAVEYAKIATLPKFIKPFLKTYIGTYFCKLFSNIIRHRF